jgi:hypothetical protein
MLHCHLSLCSHNMVLLFNIFSKQFFSWIVSPPRPITYITQYYCRRSFNYTPVSRKIVSVASVFLDQLAPSRYCPFMLPWLYTNLRLWMYHVICGHLYILNILRCPVQLIIHIVDYTSFIMEMEGKAVVFNIRIVLEVHATVHGKWKPYHLVSLYPCRHIIICQQHTAQDQCSLCT